MKFHDKAGKKHSTVLGAVMGNISKKANDFVRSKMPSYEETINANEHLYDYVSDRCTVYPPKDGTLLLAQQLHRIIEHTQKTYQRIWLHWPRM